MCGIAGIIHRGGPSKSLGKEMTAMLQSLKHRGPDSTGFAMYGNDRTNYIVRFKTAEQEDMAKGFEIGDKVKLRKAEVNSRLNALGAQIIAEESPTEYAHRYEVAFSGDLKKMADYIEDIEGVEIMSIGNTLELIKDLGDSADVAGAYEIASFAGTHAIGHTRMATESDVDMRSAHPYWAYPFSDVSVVHNGQLTNYWTNRRDLERSGHRFSSDCDSELIAVYIADRMNQGDDLESAMKRSIDFLDGVFTYIIATRDQMGMAKDVMAAKPMVLHESENLIVMASEEIAIRQVFDHDVDTYDPYHGEVKVWAN